MTATQTPAATFLEALARTAKGWSDDTLLKSIETGKSDPEITRVLAAELEDRTS